MNVNKVCMPLRKLITLLMVSAMCLSDVWAQLENGKVYHFVCKGNTRALSSAPNLTIGDAMLNNTNPFQLWIAVEGKGVNAGQFALRNLGNGLYLNSSEKHLEPWGLIPTIALDTPSYHYCVEKEKSGSTTYYVMSDVNNLGSKHCLNFSKAKNTIICHSDDDNFSKWKIEVQTNWDKAKIEEQLKKVAHYEVSVKDHFQALVYERTLYKVFTDTACTMLQNKYASMAEDELDKDEDLLKLPKTLRNLVKKIKKNDWTEANGNPSKPQWDDKYARKFRVQLCEPYSNPHEAGLAIGIQPHSVMNNPTGIYASKGDTLYVMVGGDIKEGSYVYLGTFEGYKRPRGDTKTGTKLKKGLNIVPIKNNETNTFICYTVETFKDRKLTGLKLSSYDDLKIHIEGGNLNGYYNRMGDSLYTPDKNEDWDYYEKRANMHAITILGKYQILHLYQDSTVAGGRKYPGLSNFLNEQVKVEDVIAAWDKLMFAQRLTLGLLSREEYEQAKKDFPTLDDPSRGIYTYMGDDPITPIDYSDVYRVHGKSWGMVTGYMVGSNGYSGYNISTFPAITVGMASKESNNYGNIWGAAHEIGHQHQALIHMNGLKESSNNIFSNICVWFDGKATSNMADGALVNLLKVYNRPDGDFFHTTLGVQMHLYYKLWLYYHLAGKNNRFYPRLFELLRRDPMNVTVDQDGAQCLLHFYKMCCKAAGEDLTEFFRAHCFFTPLKQRHVADYTSSDYTMTQEQVDAAIAEVKSWNLPLNRNIIFINDCAGKTVYSHDGTTKRHSYSGAPQADMGMYTDFIHAQNDTITGTYTYVMQNGQIVVSGAKGGVGLLAYDDEGMLQAFSDRYSFTLSERARQKLASRKLHIYVVNAAGELTEIKGSDAVGEQRDLLRTAMEDAKNLLKKVDEKSRIVGFYHKQAVVELEKLLAKAETVYDNKDKAAYISTSQLLTEEIHRIMNAEDSRISFVPNSSYLLECEYGPNKYVYRHDDNAMRIKPEETKGSEWLFEMVGENSYYIKHVETGKYLSAAEKSVQMKLVEKSETLPYHMETLDNNYFALGCGNGYINYEHQRGNLQGWAKIEGTQSRWRLSLVKVEENEQAFQNLAKSASMAEALIRKNAEITEVKLQTTQENETGYLYCNAVGSNNSVNGDANNGYNLLDKNINTFLCTEMDTAINSKDSLDHYLKVDLKNQQLPLISMRYVTRNADSKERPRTILIEGAKDNGEFTPIMTINTGLPQHRSTEFISPLFDAGFRHLRFMVKATWGGKMAMGHPYFSMSEFSLTTPVLNSKYEAAKADYNALVEEIKKTRKVLETGREQIEQLKTAKESLDAAYQKFADACHSIDMQAMEAKKNNLGALIAKTEALMNEVATVEYKEDRNVATAAPIALQCKDANGKAYLSSNADQNTETNFPASGGSEPALIDNNPNTFYHSRWRGTQVNEPHHIQVKVTDIETDAEFAFSYRTRHNGGPYPHAFRIEQSLDGQTFTPIRTFELRTDSLPVQNGKQWKSPKITPTGKYRYLRFVVTESNDQKMGQYCFAMAEFSLNSYDYKLDVKVNKRKEFTCVNDSQIIDAELLMVAAKSIQSAAASDAMIDEQIANLQQVYDSLLKAKEASAPYNELVKFSQTAYLPMYELKAGNKVGQWTASSAEAYNKVYARAAYLLSYRGATAADYTKIRQEWEKAYGKLTYHQPEADKFYTLRKKDSRNAVMLYVDADNKLKAGTEANATQSQAVWQFVNESDNMFLKSLHTTSFLTDAKEGSKLAAKENGKAFQIRPINNDGLVALIHAATEPVRAEELATEAKLDGWYIDEMASETIGHDLVISKYGYAGLYLDYAVKLPENVKAYRVSEINGNSLKLTEIADGLVPAATPVIVKAAADTYRLNYVANNAAEAINHPNLLYGASFNQYLEGKPSTSYYLFGAKNDKVGLYKAWLEYNADGTITNDNKGTDNGKHFKVSANKIYLPLTSSSSAPLSFSFDETQTGIEEQMTENNAKVIYDLQGRRVNKVKHDGLYIVNGQKVFLKVQP